jgi:hypothetical protein
MRSFERTSKIRKERSPASTSLPIPPSGSICSSEGSGLRCLEEPAITSSSPTFPCPPVPEEQAGLTSKAASNSTRIRLFLIQSPVLRSLRHAALTGLGLSASFSSRSVHGALYPHRFVFWHGRCQPHSLAYLPAYLRADVAHAIVEHPVGIRRV